MKKIIGAGVAVGIGVIGLTLVVPQAAYSAAPSHDRGHGNKYTMAQVATHNTAANCWTVVDRKVYDLTQWLVRYPTQPIPIASLCGVDSTAAFDALRVVKPHDDDDDDSDDRSTRDKGGDDNDRGHSSAVRPTASMSASASASASATATTLPAFPGKGHHQGNNPWLRSIKPYRIGKLVLVATPSATASPTTTATPTATPSPTVTPTPTPTPTTLPTFTLAQIATHNTANDCWTAIGTNVYNMSGYNATHPGGSSVILNNICGKDGTVAFNNQHQGSPNPAAVLASRKIGTLA